MKNNLLGGIITVGFFIVMFAIIGSITTKDEMTKTFKQQNPGYEAAVNSVVAFFEQNPNYGKINGLKVVANWSDGQRLNVTVKGNASQSYTVYFKNGGKIASVYGYVWSNTESNYVHTMFFDGSQTVVQFQ